MLSAGVEAFRQLSRAGDEAVAVRHPAQRLSRRICAGRKFADPPDRGCTGRRGPNAALARRAGNAGGTDVTPMGRLDDPQPCGGAGRTVSRALRAAGDSRTLLPGPRRARARAMLRSAWMAEE